MFKWADYFAKEDHRTLRVDTYGIIEAYNPMVYPQIMKMQLKHTLHQKPRKGSTDVPLPISIGHQLVGVGKHSWPRLLADVENLAARAAHAKLL